MLTSLATKLSLIMIYGNMRESLVKACKNNDEYGIVNLNKTGEKGSHWIAYWLSDDGKEGKHRIYFDSFGQN